VAAAALDLAVGMAAAKTGDTTRARTLHQGIVARTSAARAGAGQRLTPGLDAAEVMGDLLKATMLVTAQRFDSALAVASAAAAREASMPFEFGPPETIKPPYELLGELLLMTQKPREARAAFEKGLARTPNRTRALLGLARACAAAGDADAGARFYSRFLANVATGDTKGPEVAEAEAFLASAARKAAERD
jgi:hypothetical protein